MNYLSIYLIIYSFLLQENLKYKTSIYLLYFIIFILNDIIYACMYVCVHLFNLNKIVVVV